MIAESTHDPEERTMTYTPDTPIHTRSSLAAEFERAGLKAGMAVIVHSSLRQIGGWVCGGAEAVVLALMDALTPEGTLLMPTFTTNNTEPRYWQRPPVPAEWWPVIRAHMPAYDPQRSITRQMGAIVEAFRTFPGVQRSAHPILSFAAWGQHAAYLLQPTPLEAGFGEDSPLARLYALEGWVLLLGVGHSNNSSLHLAEHRTRRPPVMVSEGCAMLVDGQRQWVEFHEIDYDDTPFEQIGRDYEAQHGVRLGQVGAAVTRLMPMRPLVDFAAQWLDARG
ncbi:MAG: AAC(3) family N-acetyltransferase [Anaerolineae bacterium]